jgi:hypothetical protein
LRRKPPAAPARRAGIRSLPACTAAAWLAIAGLGCHDHAAPSLDASADGVDTDATNPLTLDIGVSGCAPPAPGDACDTSADPGAATGPCCSGPPPLMLSFAPVGSRELTQFRWNFGDGTPATTERAPSHAYLHPGRYSVTLVGGASSTGMVTPPHPLTVIVQSLGVGTLCEVDAQCDDGLACLCAPGRGCPATFVRGICSAPCDAAPCGGNATCAALSVIPAAGGGTGAGAPPVCLAACESDGDCPAGLVCATLPAGASAAAAPWTRACIPLGTLQAVGAPCRDANDALDDGACATGLCADIGALGVCSAACDDGHPCPDDAACVLLPDGGPRCLTTCPASDCARDPLLACAAAPRADGTDDVTVCSPKSCSSDTTCAPSGICGPNAVCVRTGS